MPQGIGGFWLSNVPDTGGKVIMEIVDGDEMLTSEDVKLVVVDPPKESRTPKRYYTIPYTVQNWMQNLEAETGAAFTVPDDGIQYLERLRITSRKSHSRPNQ